MASRREFLKMAGVVTASGLLRADRVFAAVENREAFQVALRVPPVLTPLRRDGQDRYEMVMRRALRQIIPGTRTPIWSFDGAFPGPTIKATRGRAYQQRCRATGAARQP